APSSLVDQAIVSLAGEVEDVQFERIEDHKRSRKIAPWTVGLLLCVATLFIAAPGPFRGAVDRLFDPATEYSRPAPYTLHVDPGDVELTRNESLKITVWAAGRDVPPNALLEFGRTDEDVTEQTRLALSSDSVFQHTLQNILANTRYRVIAGDVFTPWYEATVVDRPVILGVDVLVSPPAYTGLPARPLAPGVGDVLALRGSRVSVSVRFGGTSLSEALLQVRWADGEIATHPISFDAESGNAAFSLRGEGAYSIKLVGENGRENVNPVEYFLDVLTDAPPHISLLEGNEGVLSGEARRRVRFRITDDYGFSGAALFWRVVERRDGDADESYRRLSIPYHSTRQLDQEIAADWLLRTDEGAIRPSDVVEFFGQVRDNDAVGGYKSARTSLFTLRYPSLDEQFDRLEDSQNEAEDTFDEIENESEQLRDRFEELREEMRRDPNPDWEDERQLERLVEQHESIQQQTESLTRQMQDLMRQMEQGSLVTEETMQLYEAMQQVMEELDSPELREALEMLREAMEQMDMEQMMQSLQDIEFNEEAFRERLERAMELFERLRTAQELDEAAQRAEDLAEQEAELREATEELQEQSESGEMDSSQEENERNRLAGEQERASQEMQELQELMEELLEQMENQRAAPQEQVEQMQQQLGEQDLSEQMQQNAEQLRQNQLSPAQQGQQQMEEELRNMSRQMRSMSQQMMQGQQQANLSGLRRILDDVLTLSHEQERLSEETRVLPSRSPALRPIAQQQVELATGLTTVSDSLQSIARSVPQLGRAVQNITNDALREMQLATGQLADQNSGPAAGHQKTAMTHLNELALVLSEVLDQMQSGAGNGTGMSMQQMQQQLQQMGQQQQGLRDMMQQMLNDIAGERLTQSEAERLRQAAAQQEAIRQQLQEMLREGGGNLDAQTRSALQRVAEEMREAARQMRQGNLDREMLPRQQNILQRLLQVEESMNERGREERREGETGEQIDDPDRPERMQLEESPAERLRRDLIRALESGYTPDYQNLIKRYFEQLQNRVGSSAQ
ncbi:MAG: DUF4175 family protein, partial [Rubricoccaceae bacterium]|nr:DUF4175 family protein [Rubricoccaceae bacterium]